MSDKPGESAWRPRAWKRCCATCALVATVLGACALVALGRRSRVHNLPWAPSQRACIPGRSDPGCYTVFTNFCCGACVRPAHLRRDVVLVTQASTDRLDRVQALSREWLGPVSIALYAAGDSSHVKEAVRSVCARQLPPRVSLHLVTGGAVDEPYPINLLRTLAQREAAARSDLVLSVDVDFQPTPGLHNALLTSPDYAHVWLNAVQRHLFVLPAFQYNVPAPCADSKAWEQKECMFTPRGKADVVQALNAGLMDVFHPLFPGAHNATDTARWISAQKPYYVLPGPAYEPYVIGNASIAGYPDFDTRFVDRNRNKVVFARQAAARGFRFVVLPQAFLSHFWQSEEEELSGRREPMPGYKELVDTVLQEDAARGVFQGAPLLHEYGAFAPPERVWSVAPLSLLRTQKHHEG